MNTRTFLKRGLWVLTLTAGVAGCFRQEVLVADFQVPDMNSKEAVQFLEPRIQQSPGVTQASGNPETHQLTVSYKSSSTRLMNIEEAIAQAGFDVNHRPAAPAAKQKRINALSNK